MMSILQWFVPNIPILWHVHDVKTFLRNVPRENWPIMPTGNRATGNSQQKGFHVVLLSSCLLHINWHFSESSNWSKEYNTAGIHNNEATDTCHSPANQPRMGFGIEVRRMLSTISGYQNTSGVVSSVFRLKWSVNVSCSARFYLVTLFCEGVIEIDSELQLPQYCSSWDLWYSWSDSLARPSYIRYIYILKTPRKFQFTNFIFLPSIVMSEQISIGKYIVRRLAEQGVKVRPIQHVQPCISSRFRRLPFS